MIRKSQSRCLIIAALALLLAACGSPGKPPAGSATSAAACPPCPECPAAAPAAAGKADAKPLQAARWSDLPGWSDDDLAAAWLPFLQSCRGLASRPHWPQWKAVCDEARAMAAPAAPAVRRFFESRLQPWLLTNPDGSTRGLVTGYYEPLLRGSRTRGQPYLQPVLGVPPDLLTIDLGSVLPEQKTCACAVACRAINRGCL